jgi:hypothetical protein
VRNSVSSFSKRGDAGAGRRDHRLRVALREDVELTPRGLQGVLETASVERRLAAAGLRLRVVDVVPEAAEEARGRDADLRPEEVHEAGHEE